MEITSTSIKNGFFEDKYGKRGNQFSKNGIPTYSIPIKITNYPRNTKTFALVFEDKDAIPVCGFTWIHWLVANLKKDELEENESINATDFIQGTNSWSGKIMNLSREETSIYGGMAPPDKAHRYELYAYALDTELDLTNGFYYNELYFAMQNHILDKAYLVASYES